MPPARPTMTLTEWGLLLILSVFWGGSFFFNQVALAELPPLSLVASRVALAGLVLWAVLLARGVAVPRGREVWMAFAVMGLINNAIPFTLIVWGQARIGSGVAAILNASAPLFTVLLAHRLTTDEKLSPARLAGALVGLGGVAMMIGDGAVAALGGRGLAEAACIAAAVSYALAGIWGRRFRRLGVAPLATAAGQVTASTLILVPLALVVDRPWTLPAPSLPAVGALIGLAVISTALAYVIFFRILATAGATNLLLVTFLVPVTAVLLGTLALGEVLLPRHFVGMALIGLGLAAIDGRPLARVRRRTAR